VATDIGFGHLPAYGEAIFPSLCAALIGGAVAASAGAPLDIHARYSAVGFQALVTDAEPEGMPVVTRRFVIERRAVGERMCDDHVTQDPPVVYALLVEVRVAFLNRIVLDRAGCAIGNLRRRLSSGPIGAVAGLVDLQPDLVDCLEPVFYLGERFAGVRFERPKCPLVGGR
jgi:hypothetical protein